MIQPLAEPSSRDLAVPPIHQHVVGFLAEGTFVKADGQNLIARALADEVDHSPGSLDPLAEVGLPRLQSRALQVEHLTREFNDKLFERLVRVHRKKSPKVCNTLLYESWDRFSASGAKYPKKSALSQRTP